MEKVINITLKLRKEISVGDEDLCVIIFTWDLSQKIQMVIPRLVCRMQGSKNGNSKNKTNKAPSLKNVSKTVVSQERVSSESSTIETRYEKSFKYSSVLNISKIWYWKVFAL